MSISAAALRALSSRLPPPRLLPRQAWTFKCVPLIRLVLTWRTPVALPWTMSTSAAASRVLSSRLPPPRLLPLQAWTSTCVPRIPTAPTWRETVALHPLVLFWVAVVRFRKKWHQQLQWLPALKRAPPIPTAPTWRGTVAPRVTASFCIAVVRRGGLTEGRVPVMGSIP